MNWMDTPYFNGLFIGLGLIVAIGAQNIFIIKQGLKRQHVFIAAGVAATCDATLIFIGIKTFSYIESLVPKFQFVTLYLGIGFLFLYGSLSLWNGVKKKRKTWDEINNSSDINRFNDSSSIKRVVIGTLFFSLLNPHVYIDTLLILGGLGAKLQVRHQMSFWLGGASASYLWFYFTGGLAKLTAPFFRNEKALRILDIIVGILIYIIAINFLFFFEFGEN